MPAPEPYIVEGVDGVAVVRLQAGKGNAMNPAFLEAAGAALDKTTGAGAVVLTGYERFFCAGLDLVSLYEFSRGQMSAFMGLFDRLVLRLFTWPRPMVAAINGHAIAGGCILALACDVRVMARGEFRMGLNEIELGLPLPISALEVARASIPQAHLDTLLYGGQLYGPDEMSAKGIVDGLANSETVVSESLEVAQHLAAKPSAAFTQIKACLRRPFAERIEASIRANADRFTDAWFHQDARARIAEARRALQ
jgi:enoyl-CoA hydratase